MPDFSGPVQTVVVSHALVVLLLVPVATAIVHFVKRTNGTSDHAASAASARVKIARNGALLTALLAFAALAALYAQPAGDRLFFQHVARWLRAGELDANFDLACDPLAALELLGAAALAAAGAATTGVSAPALLAAAALVILSGDLAGTTVGLLLVAALAWRLLRRVRVISFAAVGTLAIATALLFWGTGGEWHPDGYGSDFRARLAAVAVGPHSELREPAARGQGLLTTSAYPGSPIFLDDSRSPYEQGGDRLYTPFTRLPLPAGTHSVRLHPGMGEDDQVVTQQAMGEGRELALVPIGSTLSPRALDDELSLVDAAGATSWRDAYLARRLFGSLRVAPVTAWLFVLVALLQALAAASSAQKGLARDDAKLATMVGALGVVILLRLRASLSLALPSGVVIGAIVLCSALSAVPLIWKKEPSVDEPGDGWLDSLGARVAGLARSYEARLGTEAASDPPAARALTVDTAFAAVVLLFIFALVTAR